MTEATQEPNPYAAPRAELQLPQPPSGPAAFYPMSQTKAAVMSLITFGLYDLLFWYRHWTRLKEAGHDVSPIPRAIFAPFTAFSFVTTLQSARIARGLQIDAPLRAAPGVYISLNVVARVSDRLGDKLFDASITLVISMVACAGGAWVLATVQRGANQVLAADEYGGPTNANAGMGAITAGLIGLGVWALAVLGALYPEAFSDVE